MKTAKAFSLLALALALVPVPVAAGPEPGRAAPGDDVTVIAVIDAGITPYHWDYLASKMPQANDADPSNDLPLHRPPHEWLRGFPRPSEFATYDNLDLTLEQKNNTSFEPLHARDKGEWAQVRGSSTSHVNYYWMPDTKIIGAIDFASDGIYADTLAHGTGASSVAVGNLHGSCPECLLVFLDTGGFNYRASNEAIRWAMQQPWIDAISNSYGKNTLIGTDFPTAGYARDGIYLGETDFQIPASERGQTNFFAAHNGLERSFVIPTATLLSSEAGPDWVVTVGAVSPASRASYTGHGKPADIASIGSRYPSAYGAPTVGGSGTFSGTSNATPVVAGMYGRALFEARQVLEGPSRIQSEGVIASGPPVKCGDARPQCELRDGVLTATELRTRLFHGALHTSAGMTVGGLPPELPPVSEGEFLNEGHGTYLGLLDGRTHWREEFDRIVLPMLGKAKSLARPEGEREWMVVDSYCRQHLWGDWKGGYFKRGVDLPQSSPQWPLRTAIANVCPGIPR